MTSKCWSRLTCPCSQEFWWPGDEAFDAESSASLCTSAKSNLRDRVLGEVEKNSFIALPGKGGPSGLMPSNQVSKLGERSGEVSY